MTFSDQKLLEKCREIELLCKELYDYFAVLYAGDVLASQLWSKTSDEEQNHADQFTFALKLKNCTPCLVTIDSNRIDSIITQLQTVLQKVKTTPPTLQEALICSIKMEKHLVDFHLGCVVVFEDLSYKKLFNAMMASDHEHIASLQSALDRYQG